MEYLSKDELLRVLATARKKSPRDFTMILLAYVHGLRASELVALTLDDVKHGKLDVHRLKGSLHTIQPLEVHSNPLLNERTALSAWLKSRGDGNGSQFLFTSRTGSGMTRRQFYNIFEAICIRSGIESGRRNPHILKHTAASHLLRAGMNIAYLQVRLGHADPKSTLAYTHVTDNEAAEVASSLLGQVFA
jgi:type 1 fimbriae regulatory protein FimB